MFCRTVIGYLSETCCAFRKFYLKFGDGLLRRAPEEKGPWNGFFVFELRGEEPGMFRWPCRWDTSELRRVPSPSAPCGGSHCDPGCRMLARLIVWPYVRTSGVGGATQGLLRLVERLPVDFATV